MTSKINTPTSPSKSVDLPPERSTMPIESYPLFPMVVITLIATVILGVAMFQLYVEGSLSDYRFGNKSHAAGTAVQSDTLDRRQSTKR